MLKKLIGWINGKWSGTKRWGNELWATLCTLCKLTKELIGEVGWLLLLVCLILAVQYFLM